MLVRMLGSFAMVLMVAAVVVATPDAASAQFVQPGLWEITMRMEMPGMPMTMPPMTTTQCIRDATTESAIPEQPNCEVLNRSASGNTVRWSVRCKEGNATMTGTGEMTLRGATYDGVTQMTMREGGQETQMTQRFSGRRVGAC